MKIVVCIKQVPATSDARIDPETKRIVREGVKAVINPFDNYAIEEAVRLRARLGGEVIALSMGPDKAADALREAISLGVDRAVLLCDRAFAGSDTWATSYALARAVGRIGGVDLVICGKQAVDGDTAQVGPGLAAQLGWLQATCVMKIEGVDSASIRVRRMHEDGSDVCDLALPAVISVVKGINMPRVPTLKGRLLADRSGIDVWRPADIGADPAFLGLDGSPTRVVRTQPPAPRNAATKVLTGSPREMARGLVHELRLRNLL